MVEGLAIALACTAAFLWINQFWLWWIPNRAVGQMSGHLFGFSIVSILLSASLFWIDPPRWPTSICASMVSLLLVSFAPIFAEALA